MPAVGMRRTTRIFGVVKGVDGARVLRSGRRILPESGEAKLRRTHDVENWSLDSVLKDENKGKRPQTSVGASVGGCDRRTRSKSHVLSGKQDEKEETPRVRKRRKVIQGVKDEKPAEKMFGTVYSRKRKRLNDQKRDFLRNCKNSRLNNTSKDFSVCRPELVFAVDGSCSGNSWFWSVFKLVLRYMRKAELKLSDLTAFFLTPPVSAVFTDHGVRFLLEPPVNTRGICKIFGSTKFQALLTLDFSVAPKCFMQMHYTTLQRMAVLSSRFVNRYVFLLENGESEPIEDFDTDDATSVIEATSSRSGSRLQLDSSVSAFKLAGRNAQCRNSLNSRSFQKRRSSRKRTRSRNISLGVHKVWNQFSGSGQIGCKKKATPVKKLRSSPQRSLASNSDGTSSSTKGFNSECSYANILVVDSGRCFREEGFSIMLESSSSQEWFLVIKRDGSTRYMLKAGKVMRPYSHNRFTNSILWTGDENWRLEFVNREEWIAFKDLYKECFNRNVSAPNSKVIPIPGVQEVAGYDDFNMNGDVPSFCRPESYILVKDDELSRAMARTTGIYDMDSEDDEWLRKLNGEFAAQNEKLEKISADSFELMIDGLEKGYFGCQADYTNEKAASSLSHLADREVVESVYGYWMNKRKQKKAPLLRVFQAHQSKKAPLGSKHVYRKRRSFKRQTSQLCGRSNQPGLLEDASEEQKVILKIKEAEASAASSTEVAIKRRERAQIVMEIADLAMYKAVIAMRIADALQVRAVLEVETPTESPAMDFLD